MTTTNYPSLQIIGHWANIDEFQAWNIATAICREMIVSDMDMEYVEEAHLEVDMGEQFLICHVLLNVCGYVDKVYFGPMDDYQLAARNIFAINRNLMDMLMRDRDLPF